MRQPIRKPRSAREKATDRLRGLVPRPVKRALRFLPTVPERLGHAGRRKRALEALARLGEVRRVLVLCHGNICRSPYVAIRIERLRPPPSGPDVVSAGFLKGGRRSPIEARRAAVAHGLDLEEHRSRLVTAEDLATTDLIIVMEPVQRSKVLALAPGAGPRILEIGEIDPASFQTAIVRDPWGHPPDVFLTCYDRLDRCVDVLVNTLWQA
jgi:protein-tyrosine phosphatase